MGSGISSRMGIGSSRARSRVPIVDREENCRTIIGNVDMILMLNKLTSEYGVTITNNNDGEKEYVTINRNIFKQKVDDLEMGLSKEKKEDIRNQMHRINDCLKSGIKNFTIDYPGSSGSNGMINFIIEIRGDITGGRRSKTYRTKKGTRKGKTAKKRGHRRF